MKFLQIAMLVLISTATFAQKTKIGHVDYDKVVGLLAVKDSVSEKLQSTAAELQSIFEAEQKRYDRDVKDYLDKRDSLSPRMQQALEEQFQKRQQELGQTQQRYQQILNDEQNKLAAPLLEKVNEAVKNISLENGFTYILDKNSVIYAGGEDITDLLIKVLQLENIILPEGGAGLSPQGQGQGY